MAFVSFSVFAATADSIVSRFLDPVNVRSSSLSPSSERSRPSTSTSASVVMFPVWLPPPRMRAPAASTFTASVTSASSSTASSFAPSTEISRPSIVSAGSTSRLPVRSSDPSAINPPEAATFVASVTSALSSTASSFAASVEISLPSIVSPGETTRLPVRSSEPSAINPPEAATFVASVTSASGSIKSSFAASTGMSRPSTVPGVVMTPAPSAMTSESLMSVAPRSYRTKAESVAEAGPTTSPNPRLTPKPSPGRMSPSLRRWSFRKWTSSTIRTAMRYTESTRAGNCCATSGTCVAG